MAQLRGYNRAAAHAARLADAEPAYAAAAAPNASLPESVDWRTKNTGVPTQQRCHECRWA
eukprot:gene11002-10659_t